MREWPCGLTKRSSSGPTRFYWPDAIGEAIKAIETAPFLGAGQKRDIFYNNASRFLRPTTAQVEDDHAPL